jgi:hypothetical protein
MLEFSPGSFSGDIQKEIQEGSDCSTNATSLLSPRWKLVDPFEMGLFALRVALPACCLDISSFG